MNTVTQYRSRIAALALTAAAGALSLGSAAAMAQDCKLSVHASPNIIYSGQSASVDVLAKFPNNAYAFAATQFNVLSTHPAWTFSTGGVIAGDNVFNVVASQPHSPPTGIFANPANPYRVWRGVLSPSSKAPALVEISADPQAFAIYPNRRTPSWIACDSAGGSDFVMFNPLSAGQWAAAPGVGTQIQVRNGDDVVVDGRIITGAAATTPILIGLLLPAVQGGRSSSADVGFDHSPDLYTTSVQVLDRDGAPMESHSFNFTKIEYNNAPMHQVSVSAGAGASAVYRGYRGGVVVAAGDLDTSGQLPPVPALLLASIPSQQTAKVGLGRLTLGATNAPANVEYRYIFDGQVGAVARGRDGRPVSVILDKVEVSVPLAAPVRPRIAAANNLRQLGLGMHTFEASGVGAMTVTPAQPR